LARLIEAAQHPQAQYHQQQQLGTLQVISAGWRPPAGMSVEMSAMVTFLQHEAFAARAAIIPDLSQHGNDDHREGALGFLVVCLLTFVWMNRYEMKPPVSYAPSY